MFVIVDKIATSASYK